MSDQPPAWQRRQAWLFVGGVVATVIAIVLGVILGATGATWMAAPPFVLPWVFIALLFIDRRRNGKLRARTWANIWRLIHDRTLVEPTAIGPAPPTVVRKRSEAILFLLSGPTALSLAIALSFAGLLVRDAGPAGLIAVGVGLFVLAVATLASGVSFLYFERRRAPGESWASVQERGQHEARSLIRTHRLSA